MRNPAHLIPTRHHGPGVGIAARRRCRNLLQAWDVPHSLDHFETTLGATMVLSAGKATGRSPVVVLPGAGLSAAIVLAAVGAVARTHRVFVPDLPGEPGLSTSRRPRRRRLPTYGEWLDELLPQLTDKPVILAGHSLGAGITLACTPSEKITGLVLLNPAGIVTAKRSFELSKLRAASMLRTPRTNSERILTYLSAPRFMPDDDVIDWFGMAAQYRFLGNLPRPLPARHLRKWARRVPIIVATGEQDTLFPPGRLRGPVRALLAADVQVLPGCGHLTLREFPGTLTRLVESLAHT